MVQRVTSKDRQLVQQLVITLSTTIQVTTSLPTYVPTCSNHQPPYGRQLGDSLGRSSPEGNLLGKSPLNPTVASFGCPTLDPRMFIPPWHQPHVVQLVSKLATKPQYPTYVKDIDPNVFVKIFKKIIKVNGETMEVDIINLFGFTLRDTSLNGVKNVFKTIQTARLKSWNKHFASNSKL